MLDFIKKHKEKITVLLLIALVYVFFDLVGIGCPIKYLTGISCPGCGMTRAFKSLITLDFKKAFYYHPGFILVIVAIIVFALKKKINYKTYRLLIGLLIAGLILIYIIRIIIGSEVVTINPKDGLILKSISMIFGY